MEMLTEKDKLLIAALESFLANSPDMIFIKDATLHYVGASRSFADLVGLKERCDIKGKTDYDLFDTELAARYREDDMNMLEIGAPILDFIEPLPLSADGKSRYSSTSKFIINDDGGTAIGMYGIGRDVTASMELEDLKQKAAVDSLTGLLNRKSVIEEIRASISGEEAKKRHALLFVDLDYFKEINDRKGHPFGDEILKKVAQRLKGHFRRDDVVGRVGGDEFLVLLKNISTKNEVEKTTKLIFEALPFRHADEDGSEIYVTCSIGVAMYEGDGKPFETLYEEADRAMYTAKENGKNQIAFY
ncbi:MAG: GGDEF domain-containing protein [Cloacibacillus sp.]